MMTLTRTQRTLIGVQTDLGKVRDQAIRDGMKPLRVSGALKVASGMTSVEEVMKVAPPASGERRAV
jgi:general secretion pathway protein E